MAILNIQGSAVTVDTYIISSLPDSNASTLTLIQSGDADPLYSVAIRTLIKFDLSSINPSWVLTQVRHGLFNYGGADTVPVGTWNLNTHRVLLDWVGSQVTWNKWKTGNNWNTAGCDGDDTDRVAIPSAQYLVTGADLPTNDWMWITSATLLDDVQKMVSGVYNNYGWLLASPDAEYKAGLNKWSYTAWRSANYTTDTTKCPILEITYELAGAPGIMYGMYGMAGMAGLTGY